MNTSVQKFLASTKDFGLNNHSEPVIPEVNHVFRCEQNLGFDAFSVPTNEACSKVTLNLISEMLMKDDDLVNKPSMMLHCDPLALQATEKSLYDLIDSENINSSSTNQSSSNIGSLFNYTNLDAPSSGNSVTTPFSALSSSSYQIQLDVISKGCQDEIAHFLLKDDDDRELAERDRSANSRSGKRNRIIEEDDDNNHFEVQKSYKLLEDNVGESEQHKLYEHMLLFSEFNRTCPSLGEIDGKKKSNRGRPKRVKEIVVREMVDLRSLLLQCAQAVSDFDSRTMNGLLMIIRKYSSPHGDGSERVAHYFANALEVRTAGTGQISCKELPSEKISPAQILRAYNTYVNACPYRNVSKVFANRLINKVSLGATTLHIIDFGIMFGHQWPHLIQRLSERAGGPPKLRITGIDFPKPGLRPAAKPADTCITLKKCCERFGVPLEYNGIAKKWDTIKIEDIKIEKNELLIVNLLYWLHNMPDDGTSMTDNSPRDDVMNLIRKINPSIFIHGVINGNHNMPFFVTRFRETLYHYSSIFDMFETTVSKDDEYRLMLEREVYGMDIMNVISCEGMDRIERPESYKKWQVRCKRAGFKQLPLDQEILGFVRRRVKMVYNKDFRVEEDGKCMLQGWKGRVNNALSVWTSANN